VVSAAGHWNPSLGPVFKAAYSVALAGLTGTVTLPASAFADGGGIYGVGIEQDSGAGLYGAFAPVRVTGFAAGFRQAARPATPLLGTLGQAPALSAAVTRAKPDFTVTWNAGRQAAGAILEVSAPGPTVDGSLNTFSNPNGTQRDHDGFDTGSVVYQKLPAAGVRTMNARSLGLATSLSYDVRILPTNGSGTVIGQASPMSMLAVNDGVAPDGDIIDNFVIDGANSVVALTGTDNSEVAGYNPATGRYGQVIASDNSGGQFYVFGVDPADHTTLVDDTQSNSAGIHDGDDIELFSTQTGKLIANPDLSAYTFHGGVVDPARDRADLLATDNSTGADALITIDMQTGAVAAVPDVDDGVISPGAIAGINLDSSTGEVYLAAPTGRGIQCGTGGDSIAEVNPGTGTVSVVRSGTACDTALAVDPAAGNLISINYRAVSVNFAGTSSLNVMSQSDPTTVVSHQLRNGAGNELAIDPVHHLALTMYDLPNAQPELGAPGGMVRKDSNATSQIEVIDTTTGKVVKTLTGFNVASLNGSPFPKTDPGIQLDPATRTGYTFAPGDDQIQRFSY
jgi:hypothetical protein